jgi:hypothetical protein
MSTTKKHESATAEGARRAAEQAADSPIAAGGGRWSSKRKLSVILELLRGADLESSSRNAPTRAYISSFVYNLY